MPKQNPELILDSLRVDLAYTAPELQDLRWDIAKQQIAHVTRSIGPSKTRVGIAGVLIGAGVGIYGVKWFPKTKAVKTSKYISEGLRAQRRLNKIEVEEHERIDEALETENKILGMMGQDLNWDIVLSLKDEDGQRRVHMDLNRKKKTKDK